MASESATLRVEIYSWWRSGTGAGRTAQLDALCVRDPDGLPYLPGRHLRGLLRDAVRRLGEWDAQAWGGAHEALFGEWGFTRPETEGADPVPYRGAHPGAFAITDARMADTERAAFARDALEAAKENRAPLRDDLFTTLRSTAIENGVAATHSLRAEEAAAPVTLTATVDFLGYHDAARWREPWRDALATAAPLIRAVGAKRMRGLGRAAVFIEEGPQ